MQHDSALAVMALAGGIAVEQATPAASTTEAHIEQVEACLPAPVVIRGESKYCATLAQAMADYHAPGVSIAVVHNGVCSSWWSRAGSTWTRKRTGT